MKLWRFRSVPEFLPHARWLYDTSSTEPCQCKYCSGVKSQREITATLDVPHLFRSGPRLSSAVGGPIRTPRKTAERPPVTRKRKPVSPILITEPTLETPPEMIHNELDADLKSGKSYRKGEVVWAAIDPPLVSSDSFSSLAERITHWPGIIAAQYIKITTSEGQRVETHTYDVHFLSSPQVQLLKENSILPLQGYRLPVSLNNRLAQYRPPSDATFEDSFAKWCSFRPLASTVYELPGDDPVPNFEEAVPAYILAIRMSDYVTTFYRPDFEWEVDPLPAAKVIRTSDVGLTSSTTGNSYLGQMLYQGLWWGSERIWMGDIVRIKPERTSFPPAIQECLRPPAPSESSASRTALFLHIDMIHSNPDPKTSSLAGGSGGPSVTGTLWEAVSSDWVDPAETAEEPSTRPVKGTKPQPPTLLDAYPLPPPPPRSKWRPILPPEMDMKLPVFLIAGRYYPKIITHPTFGVDASILDRLLTPIPLSVKPSSTYSPSSTHSSRSLKGASASHQANNPSVTSTGNSAVMEPWSDPAVATILALGGLGRSWFGSMESQHWVEGRLEALQRALELAGDEVWKWFTSPLPEPGSTSSS